MARDMFKETILGFAEEAEADTNEPSNLASKAGGKPVWLYRSAELVPQTRKCGTCLQPLVFLVQIYCPLEEGAVGHGNGFHRMLYVLICKQVSCQRGGGVAVLRGQLRRENCYYGWDGGCVDVDVRACVVCGFRGASRCAACGVRYCGRGCQRADWGLGHREGCGNGDADRKRGGFREVEIVTDSHPCVEDDEDDDEEEATNADALPAGSMQDADGDELPEDLFRGKEADAEFEKMQRIMKYAPDQVIRYWRGGRALWGSRLNQCPDASVGRCGKCGGRRVFEFQIMPQLIYYLDGRRNNENIGVIIKRLRDDMDFLTIAVYCCEFSCGHAEEFVEEFGWIQTW